MAIHLKHLKIIFYRSTGEPVLILGDKKIKFVKSLEVDLIVLYNFSEDNKSQVSEVARRHPV